MLDLLEPNVPSVSPNDMLDLVELAYLTVGPRMAKRGQGFDLAVAPPLPLLMLDRDSILRALVLVFSHVSDCLPRGGRLSVAISVGSDRLDLWIQGVDGAAAEDNVRFLFAPLLDADERQRLEARLAIPRTIVQNHGGWLDHLTRAGLPRFYLCLPLPLATREPQRVVWDRVAELVA